MDSILKDIHHVSFDVWNTLVKPNPAYAAARNQYLALVMNKPVEELKAQYTKTKRTFDKAAEDDGMSTSVEGVFSQLFKDMGVHWTHWLVRETQIGCHALFRQYPPLLVPGIPEMLLDLQHHGYTVSIASNTNFICGKMMRDVVFNKLDTVFDFQLYSDEIGYSKPHEDFFFKIGAHANGSQIELDNYNMLPSNVLHVGDNQICDVDGATKAGMKSLLVKDPHHTVELITSALKQK